METAGPGGPAVSFYITELSGRSRPAIRSSRRSAEPARSEKPASRGAGVSFAPWAVARPAAPSATLGSRHRRHHPRASFGTLHGFGRAVGCAAARRARARIRPSRGFGMSHRHSRLSTSGKGRAGGTGRRPIITSPLRAAGAAALRVFPRPSRYLSHRPTRPTRQRRGSTRSQRLSLRPWCPQACAACR
jgi:hypothetical protein